MSKTLSQGQSFAHICIRLASQRAFRYAVIIGIQGVNSDNQQLNTDKRGTTPEAGKEGAKDYVQARNTTENNEPCGLVKAIFSSSDHTAATLTNLAVSRFARFFSLLTTRLVISGNLVVHGLNEKDHKDGDITYPCGLSRGERI